MNRPEQIREARERLGMTQETLAERLGVSRQAVSKWEMGVSEPSLENQRMLSDILNVELSFQDAKPAPPNRWKLAAGVSIGALLIALCALALLWASMNKNGWPPKEPELTGVYFYDEEGDLLQTEAGWYFFAPGSRVTVLVTFQNGRWTLSNRIASVLGAALYLTPTGTEVYDQREQLAVQAISDGNTFALFSWEVPAQLMGHLDVVLECSGGQTITETFNVTLLDE